MTTQLTTKKMMIALEGTKGSGKSTLFEKLLELDDILPVKPVTYRPTSPAPDHLHVASILSAYPFLAKQDCWQEKLYAERAAWHTKQIPSDASFILADRCIATSYATRWYKWGDPMFTIQKVDALHINVPVPNMILWLDCPPEIALKRIAKRPERNYGLADEGAKRIKETYAAYCEMMVLPPLRLASTLWIRVNASQPIDRVLQEVLDILDYNISRTLPYSQSITA